MSRWWLAVVTVRLRRNCTPVTLAPVVRNWVRRVYSPSTPPTAVPPLAVARTNDLLVSTAVPSVIRLFRPAVPPAFVVQLVAPPMQEMPRCTEAPSIVTTCQATVTVVPAAPSFRESSRLVVVVVHGEAPVPRIARISHCSSALTAVEVLRTEVRTKLLVQSTEVSDGAAVGVRLVPVKVAVPRCTDTPAVNSTTWYWMRIVGLVTAAPGVMLSWAAPPPPPLFRSHEASMRLGSVLIVSLAQTTKALVMSTPGSAMLLGEALAGRMMFPLVTDLTTAASTTAGASDSASTSAEATKVRIPIRGS